MTSCSLVARAAPVVIAATILACDFEKPTVSRDSPAQVAQHLAGNAAVALKADGQFELPAPVSLNGERLISEAQAKRLALAFLRTFGQSFKPWFEATRGTPVNLAALVAHPRIYFAQSPYARLTRDDVHPSYRRHFGPYFLVTFLEGGEPAVQIAVSALATDYEIGANGLLVLPGFTGSDFIPRGIPKDGSSTPLTPEEAVELGATTSGARVESVPELVLVDSDYSPNFAKWQLTLDAPIQARDLDGRPTLTRTLLIGPETRSRFAVPDAPGSPRTQRMILRSVSGPQRSATVTVSTHPGRTAGFKRVTLNGQ